MNRIFFISLAFIVTFFSFSQTQEKGTILRIEPNGVVVYKPIDVEHILGVRSENNSKVELQTQGPPIKTINDYTLEELEYMYSLPDIDLKIEVYKNEITDDEEERNKEIERCLAYKKAIEERIEELKSLEE